MRWGSTPKINRHLNRGRMKRCGYCGNIHMGECADKHERRNFKVARDAARVPAIDEIELIDEDAT